MQVEGYIDSILPIVEVGDDEDHPLRFGAESMSLEDRMYFYVARSLIESVQEMLPRFLGREEALGDALSLVLSVFASHINMPPDVEVFEVTPDEINEHNALYQSVLEYWVNYLDRLELELFDLDAATVRLAQDLLLYVTYYRVGAYEIANSWMRSARGVLAVMRSGEAGRTCTTSMDVEGEGAF